MTRLAHHTKLNRESLYRMLSAKGNPQLSSLKSILASSNLRLAVEVRHPRVA